MIVCSSCGFSTKTATRYCVKCGMMMLNNCPHCSCLLESWYEYCPDCGRHIQNVKEKESFNKHHDLVKFLVGESSITPPETQSQREK